MGFRVRVDLRSLVALIAVALTAGCAPDDRFAPIDLLVDKMRMTSGRRLEIFTRGGTRVRRFAKVGDPGDVFCKFRNADDSSRDHIAWFREGSGGDQQLVEVAPNRDDRLEGIHGVSSSV